jgi:small subunit ribosomal protein S14
MAKTSSIEKNKRRAALAKRYASRRAALKAVVHDRDKPIEERFTAAMKLSKLPRNSSPNRVRNRCELTGRPRGVYRKL